MCGQVMLLTEFFHFCFEVVDIHFLAPSRGARQLSLSRQSFGQSLFLVLCRGRCQCGRCRQRFFVSASATAASDFVVVICVVVRVGDFGFARGMAFDFAAGYALALWQGHIWYFKSLRYTVTSTIDGLIFACLTAGTFGWLWPK